MDLATAQSFYDLAAAAYAAALQGKTITSDGRSVSMQDAGRYFEEMARWQRVIDGITVQASGGKPGVSIATWS